eukprot:5541193-Prymnesium_polylepis.1
MRAQRSESFGLKRLQKSASVPRVCVAAGRTRGCERRTRRFCSKRSTPRDVSDAWARVDGFQRPAPRHRSVARRPRAR